MPISQDINLNVQVTHIYDAYNVLMCSDNYLHGNSKDINSLNFKSYITPDIYYSELSLQTGHNINTNHFNALLLTVDTVNTNYVEIISGIVNTSSVVSATDTISTKRYIDYYKQYYISEINTQIINTEDILIPTTFINPVTSNNYTAIHNNNFNAKGEGNYSVLSRGSSRAASTYNAITFNKNNLNAYNIINSSIIYIDL